jgi:TRAP-type mannitol/chloroaromatic compound transport system substrate-binding protein
VQERVGAPVLETSANGSPACVVFVRSAAAVHAQANIGWRLTSAFPKALHTSHGAVEEAMALYDDLNNINPAWKKIDEDMSACRRDANLWFRLAEAGFVDFMEQQRL